jgi:hypothetical protein
VALLLLQELDRECVRERESRKVVSEGVRVSERAKDLQHAQRRQIGEILATVPAGAGMAVRTQDEE